VTDQVAQGVAPVRGTQTFVGTLTTCWHRPGLWALEIVWRWVYGIPATVLILWQGQKAWLAATGGTMDPAQLGLDKALLNDPVGALTADPMGVAGKFGMAFGDLAPAFWHVAQWLGPILLLAWVVISCFGRIVVLRRADPTMCARPLTLMLLSALRMTVLVGIFVAWYELLVKAAGALVSGPVLAGHEPNLVGFSAVTIILSLSLFCAWAAVSWVLSVAPLLAMLRNTGVVASLRAALHLGKLKAKLVEINLVMGIIKIGLLVLAMVFSATPLPFETVTTPGFLAVWWAGVTLLYLIWSDFFHVVRLMSYLDLWRAYRGSDLSHPVPPV
jgi:hypothetical protein